MEKVMSIGNTRMRGTVDPCETIFVSVVHTKKDTIKLLGGKEEWLEVMGDKESHPKYYDRLSNQNLFFLEQAIKKHLHNEPYGVYDMKVFCFPKDKEATLKEKWSYSGEWEFKYLYNTLIEECKHTNILYLFKEHIEDVYTSIETYALEDLFNIVEFYEEKLIPYCSKKDSAIKIIKLIMKGILNRAKEKVEERKADFLTE